MRRVLWLGIFLIFAGMGVYTVYGFAFDPTNPLLLVTTAVMGAIGTAAAIDQWWDRYGSRNKQAKRPSIPNEKAYLEGRLLAFAEEQAAFVALAGDALIESRFDAYESVFTPEKTGERLREYNDIAQAAQDYKQFVIVGDPGAGKSTTLRQMASAIARTRLDLSSPRKNWLNNLYGNDKPPLPLWIFLGDSQNPPQATELLDYWWDKYNLPNDPKIALTHLDIWLFLDGLNEMPAHSGNHKNRAVLLKDFLTANPNVRAIITCRVQDYDDVLNLGLPVIRVQPLDDTRASEFVHKRLGSNALLKEIARNDALKRIARNPYTLVMLIEVYRDKGQLPANLYDLYRLYVLERYKDYRKRGLVKMDWKSLDHGLQRLAFRMIEGGKGTAAPTSWVQRQIGWRTFHDGISLGVLTEEDGVIRFYHQSLHGYFALPRLKKAIQEYWYDRWRTERRARFINGIGNLGEAAAPAVPALIDALKDTDAYVRERAAIALGQIGEAAAPAVPTLADTLKDTDVVVRGQATIALGAIGEAAAPAVPALIDALKDTSPPMRQFAARALGQIGEAAVPALIDALKDTSTVRQLATRALSHVREAAAPAVPALIDALKDTDTIVRERAAMALAAIGEAAAPAVPALIDALKDTNPAMRGQVTIALGQVGEAAVPALIDALKDTNDVVRGQAAKALELVGEAAAPAVPALIDALKDTNDVVRGRAAKALETIRRFREGNSE